MFLTCMLSGKASLPPMLPTLLLTLVTLRSAPVAAAHVAAAPAARASPSLRARSLLAAVFRW